MHSIYVLGKKRKERLEYSRDIARANVISFAPGEYYALFIRLIMPTMTSRASKLVLDVGTLAFLDLYALVRA